MFTLIKSFVKGLTNHQIETKHKQLLGKSLRTKTTDLRELVLLTVTKYIGLSK